VDPALRAKREIFEREIALTVLTEGPVKVAVDKNLKVMCDKAIDYINKSRAAAERDGALAGLGAEAKDGYAGAVLPTHQTKTESTTAQDGKIMLDVLQSGNARERMIALGKFAELVANDMLKDPARFEQVAAASAGATSTPEQFGAAEITAYRERMAQYKTDKKYTGAPGQEIDAKEFLKPVSTEKSGAQKAYQTAKNENMDTKLPSVFAGEHGDAFPAAMGATPKETGAGEKSSLARTTITVKEAQAMGYHLSEREIAAAGGPDGKLPWIVGTVANVVDPSAKFIATASQASLPQKAGISGTTFRFMEAASLLGGDASMSRLAMIGALETIDAHTVYEIGSAAQGFGLPFDPSRPYANLGVPPEVLERAAKASGTTLEELNGAGGPAPSDKGTASSGGGTTPAPKAEAKAVDPKATPPKVSEPTGGPTPAVKIPEPVIAPKLDHKAIDPGTAPVPESKLPDPSLALKDAAKEVPPDAAKTKDEPTTVADAKAAATTLDGGPSTAPLTPSQQYHHQKKLVLDGLKRTGEGSYQIDGKGHSLAEVTQRLRDLGWQTMEVVDGDKVTLPDGRKIALRSARFEAHPDSGKVPHEGDLQTITVTETVPFDVRAQREVGIANYDAAVAAIRAGQVPKVTDLPATTGNLEGTVKLEKLHRDAWLNSDPRGQALVAEFMTLLGKELANSADGSVAQVSDLNRLIQQVMNTDNGAKFLQQGPAITPEEAATFGGFFRGVSYSGLAGNHMITQDYYDSLLLLPGADTMGLPHDVEKINYGRDAGKIAKLMQKKPPDVAKDLDPTKPIGRKDAPGWWGSGADPGIDIATTDAKSYAKAVAATGLAEGCVIFKLDADQITGGGVVDLTKKTAVARRPTTFDSLWQTQFNPHPNAKATHGKTTPHPDDPDVSATREVIMPAVGVGQATTRILLK
jgi:hypothetical protein